MRARAWPPLIAKCRSSTPTWPTRERQWPEFRRGALAAGVRAAFGFPLLIDRICIGALNLYHDRSGALTDDQVADALVVAQFVSRAVLTWQADAPPGTVAWQLEQVPIHRVEVHQATGQDLSPGRRLARRRTRVVARVLLLARPPDRRRRSRGRGRAPPIRLTDLCGPAYTGARTSRRGRACPGNKTCSERS